VMMNQGQPIYPTVKRTLLTLLALSVPPFLLIMAFGEELFAFVFGDNWGVAGIYAQIMSVWLMLNFLISPLSSLPLILNKSKHFFLMSIVGSGMQILGFALIPMFMGHDEATMRLCLWVVSVSQAVYLVVVGLILIQYVKGK
jgi:O-antigen/teichoic acid export membrane protein